MNKPARHVAHAVLCASIFLLAGRAYASGCDISLAACPGNAGLETQADLDCAGGLVAPILVVFAPAEPYPDLVGIDAQLELLVDGDLYSNASFWQTETGNVNAWIGEHRPPAGACTDFVDTWSARGSGIARASMVMTPTRVRFVVSAWRPSSLAVRADQKLFGFRLKLDTTEAIENQGTLRGCTTLVQIVLKSVYPQTMSANVNTILTWPYLLPTNSIFLNNGSVPAARHTWGRLKSLYR